MAKTIMIQGTMSNAGKSLLCAGLCRIFAQDGYRVAPFKSQNMALNSYITEEGLEMGRAQVVQAEAAGKSPQAEMNPILLKPTNDTGSQVIVNGKVYGNMSAREYFAYKKQLIPDIMKAFHKLEEENDIIVIEGAGSPAEINLKSDDIVNMGLAELVDAPVLLVGDIDRGGVFAQLLGTLLLLEPEEKKRVKGLIINKFRGDKTILDPGIEMLKDRAEIPVVGVTPYLSVEIEDEDSLTERFDRESIHADKSGKGQISIAVIKLPHISNFTDFMFLENEENVFLSYVKNVDELRDPDMILIPGTKNTIGDLLWMRQNGLETAVQRAAQKGTPIWGICGGYQMLGKRISDPLGTEAGGTVRGMELLPVETVFAGEKRQTRVRGKFENVSGIFENLKGITFEGYEIHMGETKRDTGVPECPLSILTDRVTDTAGRDGVSEGNIYGTYVHGILDQAEVVNGILEALAERKGISLKKSSQRNLKEFKETQYNILADSLREHLDMEAIRRIMGLPEKKR